MKSLALFLSIACMAADAWQAPVFQSETKMVLVDAVVTAKNFRVWEDNKEQSIASFSAGTDAPASEPRRVVLFFDSLGMSAADQVQVRQAAAGFIDINAASNRQMAVVNYDGQFRVLQTFTANAGRLKAAVRDAKSASPDAVGSTILRQGRIMGALDGASARGLIQSVASLARNLNALPGRKIVVLFTGAGILALVPPDDGAGLVQICNREGLPGA